MATFNRIEETALYVAAAGAGDHGWAAYLLPQGSTFDAATVDYAAALEKVGGHFLFAAKAPDFQKLARVDFIVGIYGRIAERVMPGVQTLIWLVAAESDSGTYAYADLPLLGFQNLQPLRQVTYALDAAFAPALGWRVDSRCLLTLEGSDLKLEAYDGGTFGFAGDRAIDTAANEVSVPIDGPRRGCFVFESALAPSELTTKIQTGFRFAYDEADGSRRRLFYPLLKTDGPEARAWKGRISIDLTDVYNRSVPGTTGDTLRSGIALAHGTELPSGYVTREGSPIVLRAVSRFGDPEPHLEQWRSAGLVLQPAAGGDATDLHATPVGDFQLEVFDGSDAPRGLVCGLSAGESIGYEGYPSGNVLRFVPDRPAFAPGFPFAPQSPLAAPADPDQPLLDASAVTAWAALRAFQTDGAEAASRYVTQARGEPWFGHDETVYQEGKPLLGAVAQSAELPQSDDFAIPLAPHFAAVVADPQLNERFEAGVLAACRRRAVAPGEAARGVVGAAAAAGADPATVRVATPSGFLAEIAPTGKFRELALAQGPDDPAEMLRFGNLAPELSQVFQASESFAVVANSQYLGAFVDARAADDDSPTFQNVISLAGWRIRVAVGEGNDYGRYRNVLIFKFKPGRLRDLVANPAWWSEAQALALPEADSQPDELTVLSGWLQDFIDTARDSSDAHYAAFNRIADDFNWSGILALNVDVVGVPAALSGLLAALDETALRAHHLGINVNQVDPQTLQFGEGNSIFGLIDYCDARYDPARAEQTVYVPPQAAYDFRVLQLQVSFANSEIEAFSSRAQLSLTQIFGDRVTGINEAGNGRFSIPFRGGLQKQGGSTLYSMDAQGQFQFFTESRVLPRVDIDRAEFRSDQDDALFTLWGYLDFCAVADFDLLSFGNPPGVARPDVGLAYSGLTLRFPGDAAQAPRFESEGIAFDAGTSSCRPHSIYAQFPLRVERLLLGEAGQAPADLGFLPVRVPETFAGIAGDTWTGLELGLDLGTPGDLAAAAGFRASLLIAWSGAATQSDDGALPVQVGIRLPGTVGGSDVPGTAERGRARHCRHRADQRAGR